MSGRRLEKCRNVSGVKKTGRRVVTTELHPGSKVDPHAATSAVRRSTSGSSAPSGYIVSAAKLATIQVPALRL